MPYLMLTKIVTEDGDAWQEPTIVNNAHIVEITEDARYTMPDDTQIDTCILHLTCGRTIRLDTKITDLARLLNIPF